jgi:hypothetical protein
MRTLYGARNSSDYAAKNAFNGGMIILKIKEEKRLVYLKADTLKAKNRARARPVCWRGEVSPPQPR